MTTVRIELNVDALEALPRPVNGQGGFQSLLREIQQQLSGGNVLVMTPSLVERVARHVDQYGDGGFQGRLEYVLTELRELARVLGPLG